MPPSNATPSTKPSKSMVAISPSFTALSVTSTVLEFFSLSLAISAVTSPSVTSVSAFSTLTPLYFPRVTSGFNATSAVKINGLPASICTTSTLGLETISSVHSSIALS